MPPPHLHPSTADVQRTHSWLRRLAWLCAVMMLVITSLSAFIRLVNTGVGCTPWPACYGQPGTHATGGEQAGASQAAVATARAAHRVIASSSLVVILALLALALKRRLHQQARHAAALLALALFLAGLGAGARSSLLPAVTLGNLLAGLGMIVLSVRLARLPDAADSGTGASPLARWAWVALALAFMQAAFGAMVSSTHAGLSCPTWGVCDLSQASWQALNPWLAPAAGTSASHAGGALIHLLHRAAGLALLGFLAFMAWRAMRVDKPWVAAACVALPALQILLGLGLVAQQLPLGGTWTHNLLAALLLALLAILTTARR
ncbi:MAG: COX15/CtaA family protein [Comamonas sp.]